MKKKPNLLLVGLLLLLMVSPALAQPDQGLPVNRGLVVRFYLDEAGTDQGVLKVLDRSGIEIPFDLTLDYDGTNLNYVQIGGNRGLESTNINGDQQAEGLIDDTADKVRNAFDGSKTATVEIVARMDDFQSGTGRCFVIQSAGGGTPVLGFTGNSPTAAQLFFNGTLMRTFDPGTSTNRWHAVYNTAEATADDRIKLYKSGVIQSPTVNANPALDETISIGAGSSIRMFNRGAAPRDRSMDGVLFYGAMYSAAFSSGEAFLNANSPRLRFNDDQILKFVPMLAKMTREWPAVSPAAGGIGITGPIVITGPVKVTD